MGEAILNLTEKRAARTDYLRRVQELERQLGETEPRMAVERDTMDDLHAKVADKGKQLQASQAQVVELSA